MTLLDYPLLRGLECRFHYVVEPLGIAILSL